MVKNSELSFEGLVVENVPRRLRSLYGRIIDTMPHILNGTDPKTGKQVDLPRDLIDGEKLMIERSYGENEHDRTLLQDNHVVIADCFVGDPSGSGEVLFVRYHASPTVNGLVRSLNPASRSVSGSLPLGENPEQANDIYATIKSQGGVLVFSPEIAQKLRNDIYSNPLKRDEFWEHAANGNLQLAKDYKSMIREKTRRDFSNSMGVYPTGIKGLRPVWVWAVGGSYSDADDFNNLYINYGRLVGVAPEAPGAQKIVPATLEDRIPISLAGKTIEIEGQRYRLEQE